jgi:hypothetical protein
LFNENFEAICEAIAESIGGAQVPDEGEEIDPPTPEPPGGATPGPELVVHVTIEAPPGVIVAVDVRETTTGRKLEEAA